MAKQKVGIPSGTRDFGPEVMVKRQFIFNKIRSVFERYGFNPLETPSMENLDVLMGKYGEEGDQLLFKVLNSGDYLSKAGPETIAAGASALLPKISKKGLRYDLTVPFARYVAMNRGTLAFPFKRYQIQPVWRADRPQKGRYREFYQCDADVIGTDSLLCEAEIIAMIQAVFQSLGLAGHYELKLNHRQLLAGISEAIGAAGKEAELCIAIDKLDKIGLQKVNEELSDRGFSREAIAALEPILQIQGNNAEKLAELETLLSNSETGRKGLSEVQEIFRVAEKMGVSLASTVLDTTLARGLSYYTGAIFEVKAVGVSIGSISGGGRYDNLTGTFGFEGMSGVGISFGVDRIFDVMEALQKFPTEGLTTTKVLFINFDAQGADYCLPLLYRLRQAGISAELYPEAAKMKKQMGYANRKQIPFVVLAGENEIQAGNFTLKNMATGEQEAVTAEGLLERLRE